MFGATLFDHQTRYEYAQEWLDVIKLAWSPAEDFDFDGRFIKLKGVRAKPKPYGGTRPVIMNAGASPTGQAFAIRNCDALFSTISRGILAVRQMTSRPRPGTCGRWRGQAGREIGVYTVGVVYLPPDGEGGARTITAIASSTTPTGAAVDANILAMKNVTPQMHSPRGVPADPRAPGQRHGRVADGRRPGRRGAGHGAARRGRARRYCRPRSLNYLDELPYFCMPRCCRAWPGRGCARRRRSRPEQRRSTCPN